MATDLGIVEQKVYGALLILANKEMIAEASLKKIAKTIGYKKAGGALTFALKMLEMKNFIVPLGDSKYKVMI